MIKFLTKDKKNQGFTLIELLVVITIIGVLSGIIFVGVAEHIERAEITRSISFSHSIERTIGHYLVGRWSFDEGGGPTVYDRSPFGNHGTIHGATFSPDTPHDIIGHGTGRHSLSFDGGTDFARFSDEGFLDPTSGITIEVWVKIETIQGGWQPITHKHGEARAWWFGFWPGSSTRIHWSNQNLTLWSLDFDIPSAYQDWRHIVVTYKDGRGRKGYADGKFIDYDNASGVLRATTGDIFIAQGWDFFDGFIDEVRIYNHTLQAFEIQHRYEKGIKSLLARGMITDEEFNERLMNIAYSPSSFTLSALAEWPN